jgi:hypothetical protein
MLSCCSSSTLSILCRWCLLLARMELVTNATILHSRANNLGETIVVALNLQ